MNKAITFKRRHNVGPRIIALTGPKTCGKDSVASALIRQNTASKGVYMPFFLKTPFAAGVKTICHNLFGWTFDQMDDPVFKETPLEAWPCCEPRWPMMDIANFMRDKYGPDVWVNTLERHLHKVNLEDPHGAYIITDLRFPNELDWLDKQNALIVYVERPEAEDKLKKARAAGDPKALNPSESHYDEMRVRADVVLANDAEIYKAQHALMGIIRQRFDFWGYWGMEPTDKVKENSNGVA